MQVSVARPMAADKIVFLMFMNQCWSAEAPSQETTNAEGTTKLTTHLLHERRKRALATRRKVKNLRQDQSSPDRWTVNPWPIVRDKESLPPRACLVCARHRQPT